MALPAKIKTWQHATNLDPGFLGTDAAVIGQAFVLAKNAMKGFGLNPWVVEGSSDSSTAGMDAVDRLTDQTKIVRGGGNHSWIVLSQDGSGTSWQVCFDFNNGDNRYVSIYFSPSAHFAGGNIGARPTAADEVGALVNPTPLFLGFTSAGDGFGCRVHVMMSSDGKSTRIINCQGNIARFFMFIDAPITPPAGWTNPVCMGVFCDDNTLQTPMSIDRWGGSFYDLVRAKGPMGDMFMNLTFKGFATNGTSNGIWIGHTPWVGPDEASGEMPISGVGIGHITTPGQRGRHGYLADFYTTALSALNGNSFPGDGSKSWVVFGNFVMPWNGGDVEMG